MKQIRNESICSFFYIFFIIYSVITVLALATALGIFGMSKYTGFLVITGGIGYALTAALAGTQALFFYLICNRALLQKAVEQFVSFNFSFSF